jgi:catechol 2,3-dioxygenase-like lactoylglutathione lyase family enzyme
MPLSRRRWDDAVLTALGSPVQIAYAVKDVRRSAQHWATVFGAGPFFVLDHIALSDVHYRGQPASFDHSSAYGQWGDVMVELICDHTIGPSPVADVVGADGVGLHHVAFMVEDLDVASAELSGRGWPEALRATTSTGLGFAFHDATETLGHMIEIYPRSPRLVSFYAMVRSAAQDWDGADPIRSITR